MKRLRQPAPTAVCALLANCSTRRRSVPPAWKTAEDSAALHDFRVALRRLRANQRAYRDQIGAKQDKRLRRLAHATNAARDREVQLDWLRLQRQEASQTPRANSMR